MNVPVSEYTDDEVGVLCEWVGHSGSINLFIKCVRRSCKEQLRRSFSTMRLTVGE